MIDLRTGAEAATLLLERLENDGLSNASWWPHQTNFFQSTKSEAWIFGANRSGKTEALTALSSAYLRFGNLDPRPAYIGGGNYIYDRAVKVWLVSLKYDRGRNVVQPKMFNNGAGVAGQKPFIPDSEIMPGGWNITNQTLALKNGSICNFKSCEQGRDAFPGDAVDLIGYDEVPFEEVYGECAMRVGGGRRLMIRGAATILPPQGEPGGVSWMFGKKVSPWLELGTSAAERNERSPDLDIFTASVYDNPTILPEELRRMEAQCQLGTPEYLIRMKGELLPTIGGALVYSGFLRTFHCSPDLAPIIDGRVTPRVNPYIPLCLAVDFNAANGVWLVGQHVNGQFLVLDEIHLERSDIAAMCAEFRSRFPNHGAELWVYGDATGRRPEAQTGESSYHLIQQYLTGYPAPIRFCLPSINPPVKDRVDAVNLHFRSPDGTLKVAIASHCKRLIADLEQTKWKASGKIDKRGDFQSNAADCLGYWIATVAPTVRFGQSNRGLTHIRTPSYISARAFPASQRGVRAVSIGGRHYLRKAGF